MYRRRALFFVVFFFFFSLWDPLLSCGPLRPRWREERKEADNVKRRPGGLISGMLNSEGGAITRRKLNTQPMTLLLLRGGDVGRGALDYDSVVQPERPGNGSTMALAF